MINITPEDMADQASLHPLLHSYEAYFIALV